jgi:O-antigen/teichoic acid export membrane protein
MLLGTGALITVAQLADFLYAPTDNILINKLINPTAVGIYAPAIQVDAGLLMLMTGVSSVLLPRAAIAHAGGKREKVRQYYVRGTLLSTAVLVLGAIGVYFLAPIVFKLWLNDPMPATQAILPLVLIHTVVGGSSAVGRSVLLGMGKVKPFTIAVLISGATNVVLSICFVWFFHLGLRGIIFGTIIAVVGRCLVWMPWYVLRQLKNPYAALTVLASEMI